MGNEKRKLPEDVKALLKEKLEVVEKAKGREEDVYENYLAHQKITKEAEAELTKVLFENQISELYSLSYNYTDKLNKMLGGK